MAEDPPVVTPPDGPNILIIFLRQGWPALLLIIVVIMVASIFHNDLAIPSVARSCIVFVLAAVLLLAANRAFFPPDSNRTGPEAVPYVISFNCATAIIVGIAVTVLACNRWQIGFLLAGSCLLIGGFFGLLFGYPQGVAQQAASSTAGQATPAAAHGKSLVADSAATLGKVIAGFTLAKADTISKHYSSLSSALGPALGGLDASQSHVLAGVIVSYFLATGFLCGLFLPAYFMSDKF